MNKIIQHGADETIPGLSEIIDSYAKSLSLLKGYDENNLSETTGHTQIFSISYDYAISVIELFKHTIGKSSETFANECEYGLKIILDKLNIPMENRFSGLLFNNMKIFSQ